MQSTAEKQPENPTEQQRDTVPRDERRVNDTADHGAETGERKPYRGGYRGNNFQQRGRGNRTYGAPRGSYNQSRGAYRGQDGAPRRYHDDSRFQQEGEADNQQVDNSDDFYNRKPTDRFNNRGRGGRGGRGRGDGAFRGNRHAWQEAHQLADDYEPASDEEVVELTQQQMNQVNEWKQYAKKNGVHLKEEQVVRVCLDQEFDDDRIQNYFNSQETSGKYKGLVEYEWQTTQSRQEKDDERKRKLARKAYNDRVAAERKEQEEFRAMRREEAIKKKKLREERALERKLEQQLKEEQERKDDGEEAETQPATEEKVAEASQEHVVESIEITAEISKVEQEYEETLETPTGNEEVKEEQTSSPEPAGNGSRARTNRKRGEVVFKKKHEVKPEDVVDGSQAQTEKKPKKERPSGIKREKPARNSKNNKYEVKYQVKSATQSAEKAEEEQKQAEKSVEEGEQAHAEPVAVPVEEVASAEEVNPVPQQEEAELDDAEEVDQQEEQQVAAIAEQVLEKQEETEEEQVPEKKVEQKPIAAPAQAQPEARPANVPAQPVQTAQPQHPQVAQFNPMQGQPQMPQQQMMYMGAQPYMMQPQMAPGQLPKTDANGKPADSTLEQQQLNSQYIIYIQQQQIQQYQQQLMHYHQYLQQQQVASGQPAGAQIPQVPMMPPMMGAPAYNMGFPAQQWPGAQSNVGAPQGNDVQNSNNAGKH